MQASKRAGGSELPNQNESASRVSARSDTAHSVLVPAPQQPLAQQQQGRNGSSSGSGSGMPGAARQPGCTHKEARFPSMSAAAQSGASLRRPCPACAARRTCNALLQCPLVPLRLLLGHADADGGGDAGAGRNLGANARQLLRLKLLPCLLVQRRRAWRVGGMHATRQSGWAWLAAAGNAREFEVCACQEGSLSARALRAGMLGGGGAA